jgi:hypothetical protein
VLRTGQRTRRLARSVHHVLPARPNSHSPVGRTAPGTPFSTGAAHHPSPNSQSHMIRVTAVRFPPESGTRCLGWSKTVSSASRRSFLLLYVTRFHLSGRAGCRRASSVSRLWAHPRGIRRHDRRRDGRTTFLNGSTCTFNYRPDMRQRAARFRRAREGLDWMN